MVSREQLEQLKSIDELSDRLEAAARLTNGNIVEIGGGEGINTIRFLTVVRDRDKIVIVVDPFEAIDGADESYFTPYTIDRFADTIRKSAPSERMTLIKKASQDVSAKRELHKFTPIGFIFIDGLQDKESVMSDIQLAVSLNTEIICIDDYDRLTESSQVPVAVDWFRQRLVNYEFVYNGQREVYFLRK